ncbi:MAG: hypothetical protein MZW92_81030 [Comamonadaceae bacterium]|nr:hypothetical protein [Comamonadaceae bacterium]
MLRRLAVGAAARPQRARRRLHRRAAGGGGERRCGRVALGADARRARAAAAALAGAAGRARRAAGAGERACRRCCAGQPYLTHLWFTLPLGFTELPLSTVLLFDLGVYLCVWGALGGYCAGR